MATSSFHPPDIDALLLLESPLARAPYEDLRRRMRVHQRITETTFGGLAGVTKDLEGCASKEEMLAKLDGVIERVKAMRERLNPLTGHLESSLSMLQDRTKHLAEIHDVVGTATAASTSTDTTVEAASEPASASDLHPRYQTWTDTRLHRMITDWLLRRGYVSSAASFVQSRSLSSLVDIPLFRELAEIRSSLIPAPSSGVAPSCSLSLAWCTENKAALRRFKSTLEFDLRVQEFVDLCKSAPSGGASRAAALPAAISYARKHLLAPYKAALAASAEGAASDGKMEVDPVKDQDEEDQAINARIISTVSQVLGLLAVPPGGYAYEDLYSPLRYRQLYDTLLAAALRIYSLPPQPVLHIALSAGLSSLKVPACYNGERSSQSVHQAAAATDPPEAEGAGPVNEDLLADVHREVEAETRKHDAELHASSSDESVDETRNNDCPVCATVGCGHKKKKGGNELGLGVLAKEVPWSHHSNSTIVCRITGKVISDSGEEADEVVALPNGRVYSRRALEAGFVGKLNGEEVNEEEVVGEGRSPWGSKRDRAQVVAEGGEFVTCPRTKRRFPRSGVRKVYIT